MKNKLLLNTFIGIILVSVLGTLFHFVYEWTGENPFVGYFVPVNESTWEHMKLMFVPMLIFFLLESKFPQDLSFKNSSPSIATVLLGTFLIPVLFYTYTGILGNHYSVLDISTYYISVILAFTFRYFYIKKTASTLSDSNIEKQTNTRLTIIFILMSVCFILFTYNPPSLGIFVPPSESIETLLLC